MSGIRSRIRTLPWCLGALRRHISVRRPSMASCEIRQPTRSRIEEIGDERPVPTEAAVTEARIIRSVTEEEQTHRGADGWRLCPDRFYSDSPAEPRAPNPTRRVRT